jgi:hypothetical protein
MERFEVVLSFYTDAWSAEDAVGRAQFIVGLLNDHQSTSIDVNESMAVRSDVTTIVSP